jgi:hypothetical protein
MASAARAAAPVVRQRSQLLGSAPRACLIKRRQARPSGQPSDVTASRCLRSVSAVACCSLNGRAWGRTIAGRRAVATSATQLCPAWVITTSAAQISGHGSHVLGPPRRPSVVQRISDNRPPSHRPSTGRSRIRRSR